MVVQFKCKQSWQEAIFFQIKIQSGNCRYLLVYWYITWNAIAVNGILVINKIHLTHFLKARFRYISLIFYKQGFRRIKSASAILSYPSHQICISHPVIAQPSNLHQPSCHIPAIKSASDIQSSQAAVFVQSQRKNKKQCVKSLFNVQSLQRHKTDVNNVVLVSLLLTLNRSHTLFGRTCTGLNQHNTSG